MTTVSHKRGVEEKGQRVNRSNDAYMPLKGIKEPAICGQCGVIYRNKRWVVDDGEVKKTGAMTKVDCPACRRIADDIPAGIVTLSGKYLQVHKDNIVTAIKKIETRSRLKNPLGRIIKIVDDKGLLTVSTTEDKLAQKIGREIFKAHHGALHYRWSHEEHFVRVDWSR
jgi:hypothetical protein